MFEISQLRCFVAVAEELHFGRAAIRLNLTQSPVSRQIQLLERILGTPLFERNSRFVTLTKAGAIFLPEARRIVRLAEDAAKLTLEVARGVSGSISIGFTPASGYEFMPQLLERCGVSLPGAKVILKELTTRAQLDAISTGEIELALMRPMLWREGLDSFLVAREPLWAALPQEHPLTELPEIDVAALDNVAFVAHSPESRYFSELVNAQLVAAEAHPHVVHELAQIHSILVLVGHGHGIALVPRSASRLAIANVAFKPVRFRTDRTVDLRIAWLREASNPLVAPIVELARHIARDAGLD